MPPWACAAAGQRTKPTIAMPAAFNSSRETFAAVREGIFVRVIAKPFLSCKLLMLPGSGSNQFFADPHPSRMEAHSRPHLFSHDPMLAVRVRCGTVGKGGAEI